MVYVYFAEYILHWGFSVRTPFMSGAQSSYRTPPPTTIVGALACAYYMLQGCKREVVYEQERLVSRAVEFVREFRIRYAAAACTGVVQFQSTIRYNIGFYRAREMYDELGVKTRVQDLFGPVAFGFCAAPCGRLLVVVVSENRIPEEVFESVIRVGSRESVVTPWSVQTVQPTRRGKGEIIENVKVSILADLVDEIPEGAYTTEQHYAPLSVKDFEDYFTRGVDIAKLRQLVVPVLMSHVERGLKVKLSQDAYVVETSIGTAILPAEVCS